jgi:hypothetical protein
MLKEIVKHTKDSPERGRMYYRTGVHLYMHMCIYIYI